MARFCVFVLSSILACARLSAAADINLALTVSPAAGEFTPAVRFVQYIIPLAAPIVVNDGDTVTVRLTFENPEILRINFDPLDSCIGIGGGLDLADINQPPYVVKYESSASLIDAAGVPLATVVEPSFPRLGGAIGAGGTVCMAQTWDVHEIVVSFIGVSNAGIGGLPVAYNRVVVAVSNATFRVVVPPAPQGPPAISSERLTTVACDLDLRQDAVPSTRQLRFDVWNEDEVKLTGALECVSEWHETDFKAQFDAGGQNFTHDALGGSTARYRVQAVAGTFCAGARPSGLVAVQSMNLPPSLVTGTTLAGAGKAPGSIRWDPARATPESRGR